MHERRRLKRRGRLYVLSAPSGGGKTTLSDMLASSTPFMRRSVSLTTRRKRGTEKDGKDYFFADEREFRKLIRNGAFLEWAKVFDNYYGTLKTQVNSHLANGEDVLLAIDVRGAAQIMKQCPRAVTIFLLPPGEKELRRRLGRRATDASGEVNKRIREASREIKAAAMYKYSVINDNLNTAFRELKRIVQKERMAENAKEAK